jgi:hypothetical protein
MGTCAPKNATRGRIFTPTPNSSCFFHLAIHDGRIAGVLPPHALQGVGEMVVRSAE